MHLFAPLERVEMAGPLSRRVSCHEAPILSARKTSQLWCQRKRRGQNRQFSVSGRRRSRFLSELQLPGSTARYSPHGREHRRRIQVQRAGYGRKVFLHICQAGNISLLLLGPPKDDWEGRGAVRAQYFYLACSENRFVSDRKSSLPQSYLGFSKRT
jgi:hypothetical protein